MQSRKLFLVTGVAAAIAAFYAYGASPLPTMPQQPLTSLPDAKPGECYAKVVVPAQYKTEMVEVVAREATVRYEAIPAQYTTAEQKVLVKEAAKNIVAVPAVYETVRKTVELEPARRTWVSGRSFRAEPASSAVLNAIASSGVSLDEQPAGTCLSEYYVPAQYQSEPVKVLKTAAYEQIEVIPAQYDWVEEKVLVKEAGKQVVEVPAVYETVSEQVLVSPASTQWKEGSGPLQKIDHSTGEIMCLVEVPAKYETVTRNVLKTPATTREVEVPEEYAMQRVLKLVQPAQERRIKVEPTYHMLNRMVKVADEAYVWQSDKLFTPGNARPTGQTVCVNETPARIATVEQVQIKTPASTQEMVIPAEYQTVAVRKLVKPGQSRKVEVPAVVQTVAKQVKLGDERSEWRQVLCETNITPNVVKQLQSKLIQAGFNPGPVNGHVDSRTLRAVDEYQRTKGLERGGLTLNTLMELGVGI